MPHRAQMVVISMRPVQTSPPSSRIFVCESAKPFSPIPDDVPSTTICTTTNQTGTLNWTGWYCWNFCCNEGFLYPGECGCPNNCYHEKGHGTILFQGGFGRFSFLQALVVLLVAFVLKDGLERIVTLQNVLVLLVPGTVVVDSLTTGKDQEEGEGREVVWKGGSKEGGEI